MLAIFSVICCVVLLMEWAFIERIAYTFYRPLCKKINAYITTAYPRRLFAIFSTYMNFRFAGDAILQDSLPEQYLLISNHQSFLDILLYMHYIGGKRIRFVAKKELGTGVPLVSLVLKTDQHCLIARNGSPSQAMQTMDEFAENVKRYNWIPIIFPEGTRSRDGSVKTFYSAGFRRLISRAPMPVVVAALDGAWNISSLIRASTNLKGGKYRVKMLKVYPTPTTKEDQLAILTDSKRLIEQQLQQWREEKQ